MLIVRYGNEMSKMYYVMSVGANNKEKKSESRMGPRTNITGRIPVPYYHSTRLPVGHRIPVGYYH